MKRKSVFVSILVIVALLVVGYVLLLKTKPAISQAQAEEIALPIITMCWDGEDSRFQTVSLSSALIREDFNPETKLVWRVGGNYTFQGGFDITTNTVRGNVPEVYIDAMTGSVVDLHFTEIDQPNNPDCRQK
jgi:hypothetical protein